MLVIEESIVTAAFRTGLPPLFLVFRAKLKCVAQ